MIYKFMEKLSKDMSTLEDNISMHKTTMEHVVYRRIISLYDQLEVWITYLREKNP
jgi:hypothetical protein